MDSNSSNNSNNQNNNSAALTLSSLIGQNSAAGNGGNIQNSAVANADAMPAPSTTAGGIVDDSNPSVSPQHLALMDQISSLSNTPGAVQLMSAMAQMNQQNPQQVNSFYRL